MKVKNCYTISDLMIRYGLTRQAVRQYLNNHISEVNAHGIHAKKEKGDWIFDDVALRVLDKIRGYNTNLELEAEVRSENEKKRLLEEISSLKTAMLNMKEHHQQQINAYRDKLDEWKDQAHKAELLQLESKSYLERLKEVAESEKATLLADLNREKEQRAALEKENAARDIEALETAQKIEKMEQERETQAEEIYRLRRALNAERQKSWWDKLFDK